MSQHQPFRTKLDFSDNRQIKQRQRTFTDLEGGTVFGVSFSALTSGPGPECSAVTETNSVITGNTFSSNTITTNYVWADPRLYVIEPYLSAWTPINSGTTQQVGNLFFASNTTVIDGNTVVLEYSGVSVDGVYINYLYDNMTQVGVSAYTGTVTVNTFDILSACSLDYSGRTIWVDNPEITRTKKLIITNNATPGYVLTCYDSEGLAEWQPSSGGTSGGTILWTAGTGTAGSMVQAYTNSTSSGDKSVVGGSGNSSAGNLSVILGGFGHNITTGADIGAIIGGANHTITSAVDHSVAIGGVGNTVANSLSGIFVGQNNILSGGTDIWSAIIAGKNNILNASRSVILGGTNIIGTEDDTVYTPKIRSYSGLTFGTLEGLGNNILNYTEIANNAISDEVIANVNVSRVSGLTSNSLAKFIGSRNMALFVKDSPYTLTTPNTSAVLIGSDNIAYVSSTGGTIGKIIGVRSTIYSTLSGGTVDNAHYYRANAPEVGGMYGIQSITGFFMEPHSGSPGYSGGTTQIWGVYIDDSDANNYFGDNVWVATTAGTESLDINGNGRFRSIGSTASAGALHYTANGTLTTNTSDARLKTNVQTLTGALDKVNALRGVSYNWMENPTGDTRIGFIAQEVNTIVPELVFVNPNSSEQYMGVHYDNITALLVEAIKELSGDNSPLLNREELILETQTIASEDNNIELNFNGTTESAIDGGITVIKGIDDNTNSEFKINSNGDWITNNYIIPYGMVIPKYTPVSTSDEHGKLGEITRDDNYIYIKTESGWLRSNLETF